MNQLLPPQIKQSSFVSETRSNEGSQRFLGFSIGDRINALIPLEDLRATIKISLAEILPVPQMKESLLGIINYGGKATWVVDLAHLMGAPHYHQETAAKAAGMGMLFQVKNDMVALLVQKISTIEAYDPDRCLSIGDAMFPDRMRMFLSGYFIDDRQQPWVVVDLQRAIDSLAEPLGMRNR
jgi:positive phototaxis protein PixI